MRLWEDKVVRLTCTALCGWFLDPFRGPLLKMATPKGSWVLRNSGEFPYRNGWAVRSQWQAHYIESS